jgi:hypothetical protein
MEGDFLSTDKKTNRTKDAAGRKAGGENRFVMRRLSFFIRSEV